MLDRRACICTSLERNGTEYIKIIRWFVETLHLERLHEFIHGRQNIHYCSHVLIFCSSVEDLLRVEHVGKDLKINDELTWNI